MESRPRLHIRPYQPDDEDQVVELWTRCGLVVPQNDPRRDIQAKMNWQPEMFLVGAIGDQVMATVMVGYEGHRGWINYLAVSPDVRRSGIGRLMMEEAKRLLSELGCQKINLQVRTSNSAVIEFYERIGYKIDDVTSLGMRL